METNNAPAAHRAIILGGTSGLGLATAKALKVGGSNVTITGRNKAKTEDIAGGIGVSAQQLDLSEPHSVASFVQFVEESQSDQIVLNSGGPPAMTAQSVSSADVTLALEYLLYAQIDIVRAALPFMTAQRWGRIVAIGSSGVQQPITALALSNIGRAGLAAYLKSLASDVARTGVTVNMVIPGRIETPRIHARDSQTAKATGRDEGEVRADSEEGIPIGRYGEAREFASAVAYLCSEDSSYVTGEQLRVDGGLILHY